MGTIKGIGYRQTNNWKADIIAAKELCYSREVIEALSNEPNPIKRSIILTTARTNLKD